jgi:hypothetical protein
MARALRAEQLDFDLYVHQGLHGSPYQAPHFRNMLEFMWRHMKHPDGTGAVVTRPDRFDFRTIRREFGVWGWKFATFRPSMEFLNLTDVSCRGLTMRGTGKVNVTVPSFCKTGLLRQRKFTVDLGPSQSTDEPHGAGAYPTYGRTRTIKLTRL